jgi:hypothetical protein
MTVVSHFPPNGHPSVARAAERFEGKFVDARFFPVEFFDGGFHRTTGTLDQKVAGHEMILPYQVLEITTRFLAETVDAEICFSVVIADGQIIPPRFDETVAMSTETSDKKRSLATFHFISPRALSVNG